ncbi:hypothetical protein BH24ACI5_BH24ACI5_12260 [soil metagenome]
MATMNVKALLFALCLAILAPDPRPMLAQETGPFALAVLRRDGLVVPFATFSGKRWAKRWPERKPLELPISLGDVPDAWWGIEPPRRMHLWNEGVRIGEVLLKEPTVAALMCEPRPALKSDYKATAPVPPRFVLPYPKDGLLVSGDVPVMPIDAVEPDGAEGKNVLALAVDQFNKQENLAAGRFTSWRHPLKAAERKLLPIVIEALYRAPIDDPGWTAYFMEAVRQFPPGPAEKDGCGLATYASGWVIVGPGGASRTWLGARVTYCDRKGVGYMLPFGRVRANDRTYWVFQYAGFEAEAYEVARPAKGGVQAEVVYTVGTCGR